MVLAIAALLLQMGSPTPAVPAAAASAAGSAKAAAAAKANPAPADLPTALVPSSATPNTEPSPTSSSDAQVSQESRPSAALRTTALNVPASDSQILSTIHIPDSNSKPLQRVGVDAVPSRRTWLALSIAQSSAAGFDAYATRRAIQNGAYEADPTMRPFASSSGIYAAIQVCPLVLDYTAKRMQRSENPLMRHTWWLPQAVGTGVYLLSGAHDLQVAAHH